MAADQLKTERVHLRLTPEEREQLKLLADRHLLTMSEYLRLLLNREINKSH